MTVFRVPFHQVKFGSPLGALTCGNKMHKTNPPLATAPTITFGAAKPTAGYVLMMIDPDAPRCGTSCHSQRHRPHEERTNPAVRECDALARNGPIVRGSFAAPSYSPIRHWLVVNIPGKDLAKGDISKGKTMSPYHPPGPPSKTGYHRYGQVNTAACDSPSD